MPKVHLPTIPLLIHWPTVLTHFTFETYTNNPKTLDYATLESWLLTHAQTLLSITISCVRQQHSTSFFNASLFPSLQYLQLWRWPLNVPARDYSSSTTCVLGPSLTTFTWDYAPPMAIEYDNPDYWSPLCENEIAWLRTLATSASERKAALTTIVIKYTLEQHLICRQAIDYPWEYLAAAASDIAKLGIRLVYDEPNVSKEELMQYYQTGENPDEKFWRQVRYLESRRERSETEEEEEVRLEQRYENMLREVEYHGEDVRKYFVK
jgi:hypothetical protein